MVANCQALTLSIVPGNLCQCNISPINCFRNTFPLDSHTLINIHRSTYRLIYTSLSSPKSRGNIPVKRKSHVVDGQLVSPYKGAYLRYRKPPSNAEAYSCCYSTLPRLRRCTLRLGARRFPIAILVDGSLVSRAEAPWMRLAVARLAFCLLVNGLVLHSYEDLSMSFK